MDAFVTKINSTGSGLGYSTYLGGSGNENYGLFGGRIAVDSTGNAYVTGWTTSTDFPTKNALQPTFGGVVDAFVAKIDAAGSAMVYSTYLGGSDYDAAYGIAVDTSGDVYVSGLTGSADFPIANAFQATDRGGSDAFVTEVNSAGSALVYSTYLGGKHDDSARGLALDAAGSVFITGDTGDAKGAAFPTTPLVFQQSYGGGGDGFVAKIAQQTFLAVSSRVLTFGDQVIGTTSRAKKLKVTNMGASTLAINKIYIAGANAGDFGQTNTCGSSLAAGANCTISVTFAPTVKNKRKAVLGISSSDPASPDAIALSGSGTVVSLSPSKLSFGDQPVGTHSAPQNVTLKNTGSTQLNFTGITITGTNAGDFSQTNTCGTSIAAGASCTITMTFKPTAQGTRKAAASISDDGGGSPQTVALSGIGTTVKLSPTSLSFGTVEVGTASAAKTVTLTNVGTTTLSIIGIAITGTNAGNFSQTHTCGSSLAAGASCTISVTFKPTASGTRTAALSVSDSAAGSPQKAALYGAGLVP